MQCDEWSSTSLALTGHLAWLTVFWSRSALTRLPSAVLRRSALSTPCRRILGCRRCHPRPRWPWSITRTATKGGRFYSRVFLKQFTLTNRAHVFGQGRIVYQGVVGSPHGAVVPRGKPGFGHPRHVIYDHQERLKSLRSLLLPVSACALVSLKCQKI